MIRTLDLDQLPGSAHVNHRADGVWMYAPEWAPLEMARLMQRLEARLCAITLKMGGEEENRLTYHIALSNQTIHISTGVGNGRAVSIAEALPAAGWFEQELHQRYGIYFTGPAGTRPTPDASPSRLFLQQRGCFYSIEQQILCSDYATGLALIKQTGQPAPLAAGLAYALAVESLAACRPPPRAGLIRSLAAECERLQAHLDCLAHIAGSLDRLEASSRVAVFKEQFWGVAQALFGPNGMADIVHLGGVRRDLAQPETARRRLAGLQPALQPLIKDWLEYQAPASIAINLPLQTGLTRLEALNRGVTGPLARAAGLCSDVRQDAPYSGYRQLDFQIATELPPASGPLWAIWVTEIAASLQWITRALQRVPSTPPDLAGSLEHIPPGEATGRVEAPGGEYFVYLVSNGGPSPCQAALFPPELFNAITSESVLRAAAARSGAPG